VSLGFGSPAQAARYADVRGYYEPGRGVDAVFHDPPLAEPELFNNPLAALGGPGDGVELSAGTMTNIVSLGGYSDDPDSGTNDRTPGLVVGFSTPVRNGDGADLRIVGNAPSSFVFYEPGFIEVARETTDPDAPGATAEGWRDETFFLLRPSNFDLIADPRVAANPIEVVSDPLTFELTYSEPFDDPDALEGYFDVTSEEDGGDVIDLSNAIDAAGDFVSLEDIAYLRLRGVSDSVFPFGTAISPEVDYIEVLSDPTPIVLGDMDGNGVFDAFDVDDFELALADRQAYLDSHGELAPDLLGDFDASGALDAFDVNGFETALASIDGLKAAPEPATGAWVVLGVVAFLRRRGGEGS